MFDEILIPTDGSQDMQPVIERGIELATMCSATVHALHVVDERAYASVPSDARERVRETLEEDGNAATKATAQAAIDAGLETKREIRWGNPPAAILAYAADNGIDGIVMGTHGRTGYERYLMGSVAEKVVRAAEIPVVTIPVENEENEGNDHVQFPH